MDLEVIDTEEPSSVGLTSNALPKVQDEKKRTDSDTGVSTRSMLSPIAKTAAETSKKAKWYVLKTTYGREKQACDYLIENNVETYYPTITTVKEIQGKRKSVKESRLPNLFFAYGTENRLTPLVQLNPVVPYLRFYCRYFHAPDKPKRQIITVPQRQMDSLKKICESEEDDTLLYTETIHKFEKGELVRVIKGPFSGVEGRVARFKGQQRVGVVIEGLLTVATAYVPNAYLEVIEE